MTPDVPLADHVATLTTDCDRHAEWWGRVFGATVTFQMEKLRDAL